MIISVIKQCVIKYCHRVWTDRTRVTLVRPPGLNGPVVSGDVCALGDGDAFDSVGPEERERRRTPLCDLTEGNTVTKQASS